MYWAEALANQNKDAALKAQFEPVALTFKAEEKTIIKALNDIQGKSVDIGGYYKPNDELATKAMRPSETFNAALKAL